MDFEGLECPEVATKLRDCVTYDRVCFVAACNSKHSRMQEPMHAANVCEREISAIVDVEVEIQVIRPDAHTDTGRSQQINSRRAGHTQADTEQTQPWEHE